MTEPDYSKKIWRYMSYSRFVWFLQKRQLWLSRADFLGDPWELSLAGDQLDLVIRRHPISNNSPTARRHESAIQRAARINDLWRKQTFVNCWSASENESNALWRIYCPTFEGVAIQTTLAKLQASVSPIGVYEVEYGIPGSRQRTPTRLDLITKKRAMFEYEREVRIVKFINEERINIENIGFGLTCNIINHLESIQVHPEADHSFMETVISTIDCYSPELKGKVGWSAMHEKPPF